MILPKEVFVSEKELMDNFEFDPQIPEEVNEAITEYLSDTYGYCVETYNGWAKLDNGTIHIFDIEWDDDYRDYLDELDELELDDTAYEYYKNIILDMHFGDKGDTGYNSYNDVLNNARKTSETNKSEGPTTIKVVMYMKVDNDFVDEARKWEHHIDSLIRTEDYPEIQSIYNVNVSVD